MDMVTLKIRKPDGSDCLLEICKQACIQELAEEIWSLTGLKASAHLLRAGYPSVELPLKKSPYAILNDCNIKDRDTIIIQKAMVLATSKGSNGSNGLKQQTLSFGTSTKRTSSSSSLKSSSSGSSKKRKISKAEEEKADYTDGKKEKEKEKPKKKNIVEKLMGNEVMQLKKPRNEGLSIKKEEEWKLPPISSDPEETDLDAIEAELLLHEFLAEAEPERFADVFAEF